MKTRLKKYLLFLMYILLLIGVPASFLAWVIFEYRPFLLITALSLLCLIWYSKVWYVRVNIVNRIRGAIIALTLPGKPQILSVDKDTKFLNRKNIHLGKNCTLGEGVALCPLYNAQHGEYSSKIKVGNRVSFGAFDRIASMNSVTIEDDVLFAAFVHVTDHSHEYKNVNTPIREQGVFSKGPILIKRGSWLGFGCHVLSGVTVGEYSVIAANAVVTKDVPPYSVVAGNPAKVVKRFNFETQEWE